MGESFLFSDKWTFPATLVLWKRKPNDHFNALQFGNLAIIELRVIDDFIGGPFHSR
jgi:hypothetical protein